MADFQGDEQDDRPIAVGRGRGRGGGVPILPTGEKTILYAGDRNVFQAYASLLRYVGYVE